MNRSLLYALTAVSAVSITAIASRNAIGAGQGTAIVRLQSATPGTTQTGHLNISGTARAGQFVGGGSGVTGVNASQLGGQALAAFGLLGSANTWTAINTFSNAGNSFTGSGSGLTALNANNLASGTLPNGRLSGTYTNPITLNNASNNFTGAGSGLTFLNASNITSGTLGSLYLSGTYSGALTFSNASNSFTGNGAGLTNVNAAQLSGLAASQFGILNNSNTWGGINNFSHALNNFTGNGAGLVGVDAETLDGLDSTAFLQSVPVPLSLTANTPFETLFVDNTSSAANATGVNAVLSSTTQGAGSAAVAGTNKGTGGFGYGVFGQHEGSGIGVFGATNSGIGIQAYAQVSGLALQAVGKTELAGNVSIGAGNSPLFPLDFPETLGNKISLWGISTTANYGFGVQGGQLQIYAATSPDVISFGYGSSTSFNETLQIKNNTTELRFRPTGVDSGVSISSPYDLVIEHDYDNDSPDSWIRVFTNSSALEQVRIQDGDEAATLFDGAVVANGIDFAEAFKTADSALEPGDLVINYGPNWEHITRSSKAYDQAVIGVVSTKPAFVAGMSFDAEDRMDEELTRRRDAARRKGDTALEKQLTNQMRDLVKKAYRPVAFMGRVPVKVTGNVRSGDHLTSSNVPGVAMAMTRSGHSIGIALESNTGGKETVMVMIQPKYFSLETPSEGIALRDQLKEMKAQMNQVLSDNADLKARLERLEQALKNR